MTAVFGIATHDSEAFLNRGYVCVDKASAQVEVVLNTFRSIRAEDIIFIKSFAPQSGLKVKAVGVALAGYANENKPEVCIPVEWIWRGEKLIEEFDEKCSRCGDPFYEEHNITVQKEIIDLMPGKLQLPEEW